MPPIHKKARLSHDHPSEILFDPSARQDYLTGFHKRKLARIEQAKDIAAKRAREEKIKERQQLRQQRREELEQHVQEIDAELRRLNPDLEDPEKEVENGTQDEARQSVDQTDGAEGREEEYVDEDKFTTVTVEPMEGGDEEEEHGSKDGLGKPTVKTRRANGAAPSAKKHGRTNESVESADSRKRKKKKFRYESKAERKQTRFKQKTKSVKAAKARRDQ